MIPRPISLSSAEEAQIRRERDSSIQHDEPARALELTRNLATQSLLGLNAKDIYAQAYALFMEGQRQMNEEGYAQLRGESMEGNTKVLWQASRQVYWSAVRRGVQEERPGNKELSQVLSNCWFGLRRFGVPQNEFDQEVFRLRRERDARQKPQEQQA